AGEVHHGVHLAVHKEGFCDILLMEGKILPSEQACDVLLPARAEIVDADDFVTLSQKSVAEVGTEESGPPGNDHPHWALTSLGVTDASPRQWYSKPASSRAALSRQWRPSTTIGRATRSRTC